MVHVSKGKATMVRRPTMAEIMIWVVSYLVIGFCLMTIFIACGIDDLTTPTERWIYWLLWPFILLRVLIVLLVVATLYFRAKCRHFRILLDPLHYSSLWYRRSFPGHIRAVKRLDDLLFTPLLEEDVARDKARCEQKGSTHDYSETTPDILAVGVPRTEMFRVYLNGVYAKSFYLTTNSEQPLDEVALEMVRVARLDTETDAELKSAGKFLVNIIIGKSIRFRWGAFAESEPLKGMDYAFDN